jgi:hypothetical protein
MSIALDYSPPDPALLSGTIDLSHSMDTAARPDRQGGRIV